MAFTARAETYARGSFLTSPFNFTINKATSVADGDIMFMYLATYVATPPTVDSVPSGWEFICSAATSSSSWFLYYKIASGEGTNYTWSLNKSCRYYALNIAYTSGDFDVTSISDITAISNTLYATAGTVVRAASMNVPDLNSPLVYFGAVYSTTVRRFTKPSVPTTDWVEDADQGHTTPDISLTNGSMIWSSNGDTGDMDITCSASITTQKHAFAIALKPSLPPSPSVTPSISFSQTPTITPSVSFSQTPSITPSISFSQSPSITPSISFSRTPSITPSISFSQSPTITPSISFSRTPSVTPSVSFSQSPSFTPSISLSRTPSITPSISISQTLSITPTITPSISFSQTPSITPTISETRPLGSPSVTPSITPSISFSRTPSITPSISFSRTPSITPSVSFSQSPSITPSISFSRTPSITPSISFSRTPSITPSVSFSRTPSITPSVSFSRTPSVTPSISFSRTPSITPSVSFSQTPTRTPSVSFSRTPSITPSISISISFTPSRTPTLTPTESQGTIHSHWGVKYSTISVPNTIKNKNMVFGYHSDADFGPTEITGFWNGIDPPIGGYTIYHVTASRQEPSIHIAHNDAECINFARLFGGVGINTIDDAITYFSTINPDTNIFNSSGIIT